MTIRAERQRERANRWMQIAQTVREQFEDLCFSYRDLEEMYIDKVDYANKIENQLVKLKNNLKMEQMKVKDLLKIRYELQQDLISDFFIINKYKSKDRAIKEGEKVLKKKREERIAKKVEKLITSPLLGENDEPVTWLRRAIKRSINAPGYVYIDIVDGYSPPKLNGNPGHHTTLSGKTIVDYPNAYKRHGGRTWYHCSTERVTVGMGWIMANLKKLARSEAEIKIK
jgi:hypothetical protein